MKVVSQNKMFKLVCFTQDDFLTYREKIAEDFSNIFATDKKGNPADNKQDAKEQIEDLMTGFYYDDCRGFIYFIYNNNDLPISVAVYSEDNYHLHLEIIATREGYKTMGFASNLCLQSFSDLANNYDVDTITATVNTKNYQSNYLQESLMRNENIDCFITNSDDRIGYTYDIRGLVNAPQMEQ